MCFWGFNECSLMSGLRCLMINMTICEPDYCRKSWSCAAETKSSPPDSVSQWVYMYIVWHQHLLPREFTTHIINILVLLHSQLFFYSYSWQPWFYTWPLRTGRTLSLNSSPHFNRYRLSQWVLPVFLSLFRLCVLEELSFDRCPGLIVGGAAMPGVTGDSACSSWRGLSVCLSVDLFVNMTLLFDWVINDVLWFWC